MNIINEASVLLTLAETDRAEYDRVMVLRAPEYRAAVEALIAAQNLVIRTIEERKAGAELCMLHALNSCTGIDVGALMSVEVSGDKVEILMLDEFDASHEKWINADETNPLWLAKEWAAFVAECTPAAPVDLTKVTKVDLTKRPSAAPFKSSTIDLTKRGTVAAAGEVIYPATGPSAIASHVEMTGAQYIDSLKVHPDLVAAALLAPFAVLVDGKVEYSGPIQADACAAYTRMVAAKVRADILTDAPAGGVVQLFAAGKRTLQHVGVPA